MNTIVIDDSDKLNEIYRTANCQMPENFVFEKFKLIFEDYKCIVNVNRQLDDDFVYIIVKVKDLSDVHEAKIFMTDEGNFCGIEIVETTHPKWEKAAGRVPCEEIFCICNYIMSFSRRRTKKAISETEKSSYRTVDQKKNHRPKKVFLLDEIVEYVSANGLASSGQGTNQIQCPCWSVRGHYRHYKSGKTVFIKSYEKGKERGKIAPKDKVYMV